MVLIIKCLHMFLEAFISLHLNTSKITNNIVSCNTIFSLKLFLMYSYSGKEAIKLPTVTDIDIYHQTFTRNKLLLLNSPV